MPLLGAHVSIAGGVVHAIERGEELGCGAIQIFVKNANQWRARPLAAEEAAAFRAAHEASRIGPLVAHATYLINLCAADRGFLTLSRETLGDELDRCALRGVAALVVHPGAHMGRGEGAGLARIADSLDAVFADRPDCPTRVLLELTAGQGTALGHRLEHLAAIRESAACRDRVGFCLDTCHAFAAGYPIHEEEGMDSFLDEAGSLLGLDRIGCLHLNDSLRPFGSRRDRHAHIGEGEIGLEAFARLLGDRRFQTVPMLLETEPGPDAEGHRRDLTTLRRLMKRRAGLQATSRAGGPSGRRGG